MLMPQRAARLRDQVYETLRGMLRDGTFPEGRTAEEEMAVRLHVSRTPVREALFQLCREGVLQDTGRGYRRPELTRQDVQEIVELRRLLEPAMARAVVANATPATEADFAAVVAREEAAIDSPDPAPFIAANAEFRQLFIAACGNGRIGQVVQTFDDQVAHLRLLTLGPPANRRATAAAHRGFVTALTARDGDGAARATVALLDAASAYYGTVW